MQRPKYVRVTAVLQVADILYSLNDSYNKLFPNEPIIDPVLNEARFGLNHSDYGSRGPLTVLELTTEFLDDYADAS